MEEYIVDKYVALMKVVEDNKDKERAHFAADILLCALLKELGYDAVVRAYQRVKKWYN